MGKAAEETEPTSLTLLFKHGRQTILLLASPLSPFSSIIADLLTILSERYPSGIPQPNLPPSTSATLPIPESVADVILGVPLDVYEPSKGWQELATDGEGGDETPKGLGLKDGSLLAFTFASERDASETVEFPVEWSSYDEHYPGQDGEPVDEDED